MEKYPRPSLRGYLSTLRRQIREESSLNLEGAAGGLGAKAVRLGFGILELVEIHEQALESLRLEQLPEHRRVAARKRASAFFAKAISPLEDARREGLNANIRLESLIGTLRIRTEELAASNDGLKQEIVRREAVQDSLRISECTSSQLLEKSRQMQDELRSLSRRLLSAQEEERKRISRELHDVVAQTLAGVNVRLADLKLQTIANSKDLHKKIALTQKLLEKSMGVVHRFALNLRPTVLDDLGLIPALESFTSLFEQRSGIQVVLTASKVVEKLGSDVRTALYRVAQEALTNVARHAKATQAELVIRHRRNSVVMEITDNGRGFQIDGIRPARGSHHLGLLGMRERMEMVGGTFHVESSPGSHTRIHIAIPRGDIAVTRRARSSPQAPISP